MACRLRDDTTDRLDDIGERTFNQRKELDEKLASVQVADRIARRQCISDATPRRLQTALHEFSV